MKKFQPMSDSEMDIMKVIWESAAPVTVSQLLSIFESKKWKAQTMATFLTRLSDKGIVTITREGRGNLYTPAITQREYHQLEAQSLLDDMYHGSLKSFLSTLYNGSEMAEEDLEELREWFEKAGGENGDEND